MSTKITKVIRREVTIHGIVHTVTLTPDGVKVTVKRRRNGIEVTWAEFVGAPAP